MRSDKYENEHLYGRTHENHIGFHGFDAASPYRCLSCRKLMNISNSNPGQPGLEFEM